MLELNDVNVYYGGIQALRGVSLTIERGQIVTLIGANGAGKTTTLRAISGLVHPRTGTISLEGTEISRTSADQIVIKGVGHCPEGRRIFANMTVRENLILGAYTRPDKHQIEADEAKMLALFPRLKERIGQNAGTLSGGEQQMLAIARSLMGRPKLLLLDEPSLGLAPFLIRDIFAIIKDINSDGTTILLVEQNAHMALGIAHFGYVMESGSIVHSAPSHELLGSDTIRKAYLGE